MTLLFIFIYVALAVSAVTCVLRAVRYARLPLNLRWELYPVPHEDDTHAGHGGSYFEDLDWWTKTPRRNHLREWKAMAAEIFLLRAMYEHNRRLWRWSYPFHLGLYLWILTGAAAGVSALASVRIPGLAWTGVAACVLVASGAAGLLVHRVRDPKLRAYSAGADYFNLCFFIVTAVLLAYTKAGSGLGLTESARAILTFDTSAALPISQVVALATAALLTAYVPMTHMTHFIGKYFAYHLVRWSDQPAGSNRRLERKLAEYMTYRPSWSAPHVGADGRNPWAEIAARNPAAEKAK